jgi:hypothetical protein
MDSQELMPWRANTRAFALASAGLRTALLAAVLLVALSCPFFGLVSLGQVQGAAGGARGSRPPAAATLHAVSEQLHNRPLAG